MLPVANTAHYFLPDQQGYFELTAWDTPSAALENNVSTGGLQLRVVEPAGDLADWNGWVSALRAVADDVTAETAFTSTTGVRSTVADGRVQHIQHYWGAGAPNWWGATRFARIGVCFRGTIVAEARRNWFEATYTGAPATVPITFAVGGNGWLRLDLVNSGVVTTIFNDTVSETMFLENGLSTTAVQNVAADTELRVYYVQSGSENWGGLVVKAYRGELTGTEAENAAAVAAAPVVTGSLFAYDAQVAGTVLSYIQDISIAHEMNGASRMNVRVPLINPSVNDGNGWQFERPAVSHPGELVLYENGAAVTTLRRKRLVQLVYRLFDPTTGTYTSQATFTGHVNDFSDQNDGSVDIECLSFEGRMVEQYEQLPDRISYMARNFKVLDFGDVLPDERAQPVYNVPAFDNWPLRYALEELGVRAGIDASVFRTPRQVVQSGTVVSTTPLTALFDAYVLSGQPLRMPRATNYGNVGLSFTENRPIDDPYVFAVEPTRDLWATARSLTDKVGYRYRFDERGRAQLYPANVPDRVIDFLGTDYVTPGTDEVHAGAYGAYYAQTTAVTNSITETVHAGRIDVSFPRFADARDWTYTVTRVAGAVVVASGTVSPADPALTDSVQVMFDSPLVAPEVNTTVATLYSGDYDEYTVVLTPDDVAGTAAVDCMLVYFSDPLTPTLPVLSTDELAISVDTQSQQDETRNKITVVGRRKSAVTDSDKFAEAKQPTEQEFVAQVAVDVGSITDPTATNYVGYLKQAIIYDNSVANDGFARYIAQAFIYRQRFPRPGATVVHTLLPFLQPGDPLYAAESKFQTAAGDHPLYVRRITHRLDRAEFRTTIELSPWPDYPAYMPRQDIDLAAFNDEPITGLTLSYTSLSGHEVVDADMDATIVEAVDRELITQYTAQGVTAGTPDYIALPATAPWPPVPGSMQIKVVDGATAEAGPFSQTKTLTGFQFQTTPGALIALIPLEAFAIFLSIRIRVIDNVSGTVLSPYLDGDSSKMFYYALYHEGLTMSRLFVYKGFQPYTGPTSNISVEIVLESFATPDPVVGTNYLANNPYHHFMEVDYRDDQKRIYLPWKQGDGGANYTRTADQATFNVLYRALGPVDVNGTLDDPYPLGPDTEPYSPFYDPYTSELGNLVKAEFDVLADGLYRVSVRSAVDDTVVAWLTNPAAEPLQDEQHWEFITVGSKKQLYWDGVDQRGEWNTQQSELYSTLNYGVFETDQAPRIGSGHYAWNVETSRGALGPLAFIWMKRDTNTGKPIIGQGTYAAWYLHIEAKTDVLDTTVSTKDDKVVFTHLPEPTKVELKVDQYNGATWDAADYTTIAADDDLHGVINNDSPLRLRFRVAARPGVLWDAEPDEVSVKLVRQAHLRALIGDQTVLFKGINYEGSTIEQTTIVNRRLMNDTHTNSYPDAGYRKANTLKWTDGDTGVTEWIFRPSDFKREFRFDGVQESIEFGNYLQLEEVPGWNSSREVASERSRLQFALISYLFYLSAYVTDRSGRGFWAMNRSFLDKSKITNNTHSFWWNPDAPTTAANSTTYRLPWPDDPMYEQRRSIVCRQWTDEVVGADTWTESQRVTHGFSADSLAVHLFQHFWWQHEYDAAAIGVGVRTWASFGLTADAYSTTHEARADARLPASFDNITKQLGSESATLGQYSALNATTTGWTNPPAGGPDFEEAGILWIPSITRDLHPYYMVPPMFSPAYSAASASQEFDFKNINFYAVVDNRNYVSSTNEGSDAAAAEVWSSPVYTMLASVLAGHRRFWPGKRVDKDLAAIKNGPGMIDGLVDYVRQDETVHWEELRGAYSRSARPGEGPVKVAANLPYYINQGVYDHITARPARKNPDYPKFGAYIAEFFRMAFRHEYLWESGTMYPATLRGEERLSMRLWWRTRFNGPALANMTVYDHGAWVGWKDDHPSGYTGLYLPAVTGVRAWRYGEGWSLADTRQGTPFEWGFMPVGVGPVMPTTAQMAAHLVLVPERRGGI